MWLGYHSTVNYLIFFCRPFTGALFLWNFSMFSRIQRPRFLAFVSQFIWSRLVIQWICCFFIRVYRCCTGLSDYNDFHNHYYKYLYNHWFNDSSSKSKDTTHLDRSDHHQDCLWNFILIFLIFFFCLLIRRRTFAAIWASHAIQNIKDLPSFFASSSKGCFSSCEGKAQMTWKIWLKTSF